MKLTASLGTPESWGHRVPAGAPARGESGSTPRPGAEDPGEAQANSLQECTSAERGIRRGYKSPERADVEETHSHLRGPVDLGGTHRDGQGSHGSTPCMWAWGGGPADAAPMAGLLTPRISPRGTSLRWWGKGRRTVTWGPGEDPLQLGKEPQGPHTPSREIRHTPWDWRLERLYPQDTGLIRKTEQSQAHHQADV